MKFEFGIEVSGLKKIVIDRDAIWYYDETGDCWKLHGHPGVTKSKEEMTTFVKLKILGRNRRAWVHGDTINIVRRVRK